MRVLLALLGFIWRTLDGVRKVLHLLLLLIVFAVIVALVAPRAPIVPGEAALVIAPQGVLVEQLSGDPFERAVAEAYGQGRAETLLRDLVDAVRMARDDRRIRALVLDLGELTGGGLSKLEELGGAIREFRESGKPVIALGEGYDQAQYYLAAHADEIYLDPQGAVLIQGYGYYRAFLKGAIDKLEVDVNVFRAGEFKTATERFSRQEMSEEDREQVSVWLEALWARYQEGVTAARGLAPEAVSTYVEQLEPLVRARGGDLAAVALDSGLVSGLKSRREVERQLIEMVGEDEREHTFRGVPHWDYLAATRAARSLRTKGERVAVLVASGEILGGYQPPGVIGADSSVELLRRALDDDEIKAVVLRIDSPGGSMLASEIIRREVLALRRAGKPVIASMSSTAASGGYYIAMDADEIWASPSTLTGSIGVWAIFPTVERTLGKVGITVDGVGTTPLAGALRPERSLGEPARNILQATVEHAYEVFVNAVAQARERSVEEIDAVAHGRVWAGVDAVERGLVDKLGSYRDALDAAAERAGLGDDYKVEYLEMPLGWRQALAVRTQALAARVLRALVPRSELFTSARRMLSPLEEELARLARLAADPTQTYYYCPCTVE
ncbi:MAG: signal peptide peptidase SppA [Proteobacteria bacterium]|nr:MAG: signal peptide peptidase SppA [Pseudomonadota bacterium]